MRPRVAAQHDVRDHELVGRVDHADQELDREERTQQRQRDVPKAAPGAGAVHLGGLVEIRRNRLETGQEEEHRQRQPAPDARDHDRPHGVGTEQPARPVVEQVRVVHEDLVHDPRVALEHELEQRGRHEARHHPG